MSPNDTAFLKALGIKPEAIEIAKNVVQFGTPGVWAYEMCPACGRQRHRFIATGEVFCLSCQARDQRDREQLKQLRLAGAREALHLQHDIERAEEIHRGEPLPAYLQMAKEALADYRASVENACRGCGAACGAHRWCRSCARDKFGNGQ
jgi:hypothetical protein